LLDLVVLRCSLHLFALSLRRRRGAVDFVERGVPGRMVFVAYGPTDDHQQRQAAENDPRSDF
jgi:hypothetical protein